MIILITDKEIQKLQLSILEDIYSYQSKNNEPVSSMVLYPCNINSKYDEHDIDIVINTLLTNTLITKSSDGIEDFFSITDKGCSFYKENSENKLLKYIKKNHLAVIAILVSITFGILGIIF